MGNPKSFRLEAAGWGFWLVTSLVLAGPSVYIAYQVTQEHLSREIPFAMGIVVAAFVSAFVTYIANLIIQRNNERRRSAEAKQAKKQKKR
ncbi:MAG: hypothetical protein HUU46_06600 [Candidatus Hydrogenedentes bacterium]|nr:hypothetical protein [Candidatus Hydrogenedentota bacterium]